MPIKTYIRTEETRRKISDALKGKLHSKERRINISTSLKGRKAWNKGTLMSEEFRHKMSESHKGEKNPRFGKHLSEETKRKIGDSHRGSKSYLWKGGISPINVKIRNSIEYDIWRNGVFARDGYTDQKYGIKGGKLVAHHILNFGEHLELRFAIDNGITLSDKAHREFHKKYGRTNNTREQLIEFLKE